MTRFSMCVGRWGCAVLQRSRRAPSCSPAPACNPAAVAARGRLPLGLLPYRRTSRCATGGSLRTWRRSGTPPTLWCAAPRCARTRGLRSTSGALHLLPAMELHDAPERGAVCKQALWPSAAVGPMCAPCSRRRACCPCCAVRRAIRQGAVLAGVALGAGWACTLQRCVAPHARGCSVPPPQPAS